MILFSFAGFIMYVSVFLAINLFIADEKVRQKVKLVLVIVKDICWIILDTLLAIAVFIVCICGGKWIIEKYLKDYEERYY